MRVCAGRQALCPSGQAGGRPRTEKVRQGNVCLPCWFSCPTLWAIGAETVWPRVMLGSLQSPEGEASPTLHPQGPDECWNL